MKKIISLVLVFAFSLGSLSLAAEDTWTEKADMPTARWGFCTSVVNGNIYAIGGMDVTGRPAFSTVEVYDPTTDTWSQAASMPAGRVGLATSVVNGRIYATGGGPTDPFERALSTLEMYDPISDTWTRKADMPTARAYLSTSAVEGKVYAIGGTYASPWAGLSTVEVYDPATDTWTKKAPMPTGRWCLSTSVVGGRIYAIGGITGMNTLFSTVEEYDPATDTWTRKADMPMASTGSASVVNGKIYVIGGTITGYPWPPSQIVEEYDPATDTWTRKTDMPTARGAPSSVVNEKIYVIGGEITGWPNHGSKIVEEYDPNPLIVDFNGDGIVDALDMCIIVNHWGEDYSLCDIGPMPWGDGIVDVQDLIVLAEHLFEEVDDPTLVVHWPLDEAQGDIAYDNAGIYDGTLSGGPVWQPDGGMVDGALQFDGIDDYVSTDPVLNPADAVFSVVAWVKGGAPGQVVLSQISGTNWLLTDSSEGNLMTELKATGRSGKPMLSQTNITDGNWHRIGFVWDGFNRKLYVDGIIAAEDTQDSLGITYGGLNFGCDKATEPGTFWSGLIDDVRIYNRVVIP